MDYLVKNISSIRPRRVDEDGLFMVWLAKHRPADEILEAAARRNGTTVQQEEERRFQDFLAHKMFTGFC